MPNLVKIHVTADFIELPEGVELGLGDKLATELTANGFVRRDEKKRNNYHTIAKTQILGKSTLWIDEKKIPKEGVRVVPMPRGYMEPNPLDTKKRETFLAKNKQDQEARAKGKKVSMEA